MGRVCYLCFDKVESNKEISLHKFPTNSILRAMWMKACGIVNADFVKYKTLCTKHFQPSDFVIKEINNKTQKRRLKSDAVPSVAVPYPPTNSMSNNENINTTNESFEQISSSSFNHEIDHDYVPVGYCAPSAVPDKILQIQVLLSNTSTFLP